MSKRPFHWIDNNWMDRPKYQALFASISDPVVEPRRFSDLDEIDLGESPGIYPDAAMLARDRRRGWISLEAEMASEVAPEFNGREYH